MTVLRVDLDVPADVNCLVGFDFTYFSEEFPEFVGSDFNDAFIAELDTTTWSATGGEIQAPDNFAFDPDGNVISVNSTGVANVTPEAAAGTTYDAATQLLSAATPITPGSHSPFLSIFDQGDAIFDSAVAVDNLRFGTVSDPATQCRSGVRSADDDIPTMTPSPSASAPETTVKIPTAVPAGDGGSGWTSGMALPALMLLAVAGVIGTALVLALRRV